MCVGFEEARETARDVVRHVRRDYTARADEQKFDRRRRPFLLY